MTLRRAGVCARSHPEQSQLHKPSAIAASTNPRAAEPGSDRAATLDRTKAALLCEPHHTDVLSPDGSLSSMIINGYRGDGGSYAESHNLHNRGGNNELACFYVLGSEFG